MKTNLLLDFTVDKDNSTIIVKREFDAPVDFVWRAWTEAELLDKWWAPKPWQSKTKSMNFEEGGRRLYAMQGPQGEEHWALADYTSISPKNNFQQLDAFCDKDANLNTQMPRSQWSVDFEPANDSTTTVTVHIKHEKFEDIQTIIEMGFKEGFTMALENLDEVIDNQK